MAFANKPATADAAANANVTGTAPVFCIPLSEAAADAGLVNIGTGSTANDASYTSDTNPISYSAVEGGGVNLDMADNQLLTQPIPASAVTRTAGSLHWRLKLPATMPVDAEYFYFASSGRSTGAAAGAGQYNLRVNATDVVMQFRSSTDSAPGVEYSVAHSASGAAAGGTIDVHFVWGTGGVRLYVNGVASPDNNPSNTGSVIIRAAAQGGAGEDFGDAIVGGGVGLDITFVALDWVLWGQELTPTQIASLREDPHWSQRRELEVDTLIPAISSGTDAGDYRISMTASANAPAMSIQLVPTGTISHTPGTGGNDTDATRMVIEVTDLDRSTQRQFTLQYKYTALGDKWYDYYSTSALTGKAAGNPQVFTIAALGSLLVFKTDDHETKADFVTDAKGQVAGNAGVGPGPFLGTEAQFDVFTAENRAAILAESPAYIIEGGDIGQGLGGYAVESSESAGDEQANSDAIERILHNKRFAVLGHVPFAGTAKSNHDDVDGLVGDIRRQSCLAVRLEPEGHASSQFEDWGPCSIEMANDVTVDIFRLNIYADTGRGDTSVADQVTALDIWAEASTADYKIGVAHGTYGGSGNRGGLGALDSTLKSILIARGVDIIFVGHDHALVHMIDESGAKPLHFIMGGGVPWHIRTDLGGASYAGALHAEQCWGYAAIDFQPDGLSIRLVKTRGWTWGEGVDNGYAEGEDVVLASPKTVHRWPVSEVASGSAPRMGIGIGLGL